jgi:Tol biopolymer transport system component
VNASYQTGKRLAAFGVTAAALSLSCALTDFRLETEGTNPNRTEPAGVDDPYWSPNDALRSDLLLGSTGYVFLEEYDDRQPDWSPDGTRIAFTSNRDGDPDIYVVGPDGSGLMNLTADPSGVLATLLFLLDKSIDVWPAWSPGGDRIVFASSRTNIMMRTTPWDVVIMRSNGSQVVQLTDTIKYDGIASWSPDGEQLVFVSQRDEGAQIYRMSSAGEDVIRLTEEGDDNEFPVWSPDGSWIAFESDRDGDSEIYLMPPSGSTHVQLTDNQGYDGQPSWSPDGKRIAFTSNRDGNYEIYTMEVDGQDVRQLTDSGLREEEPAWSPDGDRIAYSALTPEGWRIFVTDIDGSNARQLMSEHQGRLPVENGVFHLHQGLAQYSQFLRSGEGDLTPAIQSFNTAIDLDPRLAEAYLARGMALLFRCEFVWAHRNSAEIQILEENEACEDLESAIADVERSLDLGLAPALVPGVQNLLELMR